MRNASRQGFAHALQQLSTQPESSYPEQSENCPKDLSNPNVVSVCRWPCWPGVLIKQVARTMHSPQLCCEDLAMCKCQANFNNRLRQGLLGQLKPSQLADLMQSQTQGSVQLYAA